MIMTDLDSGISQGSEKGKVEERDNIVGTGIKLRFSQCVIDGPGRHPQNCIVDA